LVGPAVLGCRPGLALGDPDGEGAAHLGRLGSESVEQLGLQHAQRFGLDDHRSRHFRLACQRLARLFRRQRLRHEFPARLLHLVLVPLGRLKKLEQTVQVVRISALDDRQRLHNLRVPVREEFLQLLDALLRQLGLDPLELLLHGRGLRIRFPGGRGDLLLAFHRQLEGLLALRARQPARGRGMRAHRGQRILELLRRLGVGRCVVLEPLVVGIRAQRLRFDDELGVTGRELLVDILVAARFAIAQRSVHVGDERVSQTQLAVDHIGGLLRLEGRFGPGHPLGETAVDIGAHLVPGLREFLEHARRNRLRALGPPGARCPDLLDERACGLDVRVGRAVRGEARLRGHETAAVVTLKVGVRFAFLQQRVDLVFHGDVCRSGRGLRPSGRPRPRRGPWRKRPRRRHPR
jgi:hypothetical protein